MQTSPVMSCFIAYIQTFWRRKFKNEFGFINMWVKYHDFEQYVNPFSFYWIFALYRFCACISVLTVLFSESEFHIKLCLTYIYKDNIIDQLPGSVSYKKSTDKIWRIMQHMFS